MSSADNHRPSTLSAAGTPGRLIINRRRLLVAGAATAAFAAGPAFRLNPALAAADEQVLRIILPDVQADWSPLRGGGRPFRWNSLAWASPLYYDGHGQLHPYVFTEWKPNADHSVWQFTIDPKAVFSDGSPITAADVKGSWEVSTVPATKNVRANIALSSVAGFREASEGKRPTLEGVIATGDKTLEVRLSQSDPIFALKLANHIAPIVKVAQVRDADGNERADWLYTGKAIVSGPFRYESINQSTGNAVLVPNEKFFGPKVQLSRIELTVVEDSVIATKLLQQGKFDAHTTLSTASMVDDLGEDFVSGEADLSGEHFWINVSRKPTNDVKVRQALVQAIDLQKLYDLTYPQGPATKADQLLGGVPGVDPNYKPYAYDPAAAKKLLAESSYGSAANLPRLNFVGISQPRFQVAAEYIAEQWRQVLGITGVGLRPQTDSYSGPEQATIQFFRDDTGTRVADAVSYLEAAIHSTSSNAKNKLGGFKNAEIDKLLDQASKLALENPERIRLAQQAQLLFREEYAFIPWVHRNKAKRSMPWAKGFDQNFDAQLSEPWSVRIEGRPA